MPELCIDLGLILGTYVIVAAVTVWVVIAIVRGGHVDDGSKPDHSKSERTIR